MNDRELLERAAKAAGKDHVFWSNAYKDWIRMHDSEPWRPLTDDGDALRLAVKLLLDIKPFSDACTVEDKDGYLDISEPVNDDIMAATRSAIVRAAAEMKQ